MHTLVKLLENINGKYTRFSSHYIDFPIKKLPEFILDCLICLFSNTDSRLQRWPPHDKLSGVQLHLNGCAQRPQVAIFQSACTLSVVLKSSLDNWMEQASIQGAGVKNQINIFLSFFLFSKVISKEHLKSKVRGNTKC